LVLCIYQDETSSITTSKQKAQGSNMTLNVISAEPAVGNRLVAEIRGFIVENFLLGQDTGFADDASLLENGILDSTGVMYVVAFLEETYAIAIADEELVADNLDSVRRIATFVARKRAVPFAA
jgi:acyl carrier protein